MISAGTSSKDMVCPSAHVPGTKTQPNTIRNHQRPQVREDLHPCPVHAVPCEQAWGERDELFPMQPVPEQVQEEGEAGAAHVEETQWLWVWDLWKEVSRARQSKGTCEGMFIVQKFSKCTTFFVFRFTQGKDHISARNAAQRLAFNQTSSHTGFKS